MTDIETPTELVQRLHTLRIARGLTILQMSEICGIPKSSLESYMKMFAAKRPGLDAIVAIADGMNVSIDWLVGRAVDNHSLRLTQKDYAMGCFATVSALLNWLHEEQEKCLETVIGNEVIAGIPDTEIAAKSMLTFVEKMQLFDDTAHIAGPVRSDLLDRLKGNLRDRQPATE